jgi:hypothetical protein
MIKYFVTLAFIFTYGASFADTKTRALELELAKAVRTPAFIERVLDEYRLRGVAREVIKEHFSEIYNSNEIIEMIVRELLNAGAENWDKDTQAEYGKKFGAELFLTYAKKGMRRLSFQEQRTYIKFLLNWMELASDDDCKKILVSGGESSSLDDSKLEMKYYSLFEKEVLRNYFMILRKSIFAELRNYPSVRSINQQQAIIAESAFESRLLGRVESGLINEKILRAMADMPSADPKLACSAGKQIFATILSLDGFVGELFLIKFMDSLQ